MNFDPKWGQAGQSFSQMQQFWNEQWSTSLQSLMQAVPASMMPAGFSQTPSGALDSMGLLKTFEQLSGGEGGPVKLDAEKLKQLQAQYLQATQKLYQPGGAAELVAKDRRFKNKSWTDNPLASVTAANYLINSQAMMGLADAVQGDEKTRGRVQFAVEQWVAAMSPSNFLALNAEAQQKAVETKGESIAQGVANLLADMRQGHVSMTDESLFTVGKNVATTEGAVVFENDLFQLIEYKPLTAKVHEKPFLMVPPCINKFYILDLQPDNSMIRYAVSEGHRTFVMSWRNPDQSMEGKTWDNYIEDGVLTAIRVTQEIAAAPQINVLGFCVGGTMLSTAMAVLSARFAKLNAGQEAAASPRGRGRSAGKAKAVEQTVPFPVASMTLLTTLLDFSDTGILDIFIDENAVRYREMQMGQGGLMKGQDLASTFSFLRPNDLVWNYVVGNYLKGETPPPFDLLYWNSDSTNLPGPYYAWYLRNLYLENRLVQADTLTVCGEKIDMGLVDVPAFIYASREDHIVPPQAAYLSTQYLSGDKRFVMGASGHIAGVINPPAKKKRSHWTRDDGKLPATLDSWLEGAEELPGSWWSDWSEWLAGHGGKQIAAPKAYGGADNYKAVEAAPGSYVLAKA